MKMFNKKTVFGLLFVFTMLFFVKGSVAENLLSPCDINATDLESNAYLFSLSQTIPGVTINPSTGVISGSSGIEGNHTIEVVATDEYHAISDPVSYTLTVNSYCGDGIKQTPNMEGQGGLTNDGVEDCDGQDGIAINPADSIGGGKMYACSSACSEGSDCTGTCTFLNDANGGGWCGDGVVQTAFGEACDPAETKEAYEARNSIFPPMDDYEFIAIKYSCLSNCTMGCVGDTNLAKGCYIDLNNNGVIDNNECQKGKYICGGTNSLECFDVFAKAGDPPLFDECCRGNSAELSDGNISGNPFTIVRAISSDMVSPGVIFHHGAWHSVPSVFDCDQVCKSTNQICVGVGLTNPATNSCVSVQHDVASNCDLNANLASNDCKSGYVTGLNHCSDADGGVFRVGETACYCY